MTSDQQFLKDLAIAPDVIGDPVRQGPLNVFGDDISFRIEQGETERVAVLPLADLQSLRVRLDRQRRATAMYRESFLWAIGVITAVAVLFALAGMVKR